MVDSRHRTALFAGLVFNQADQLAETVNIGGEPHYVILDGDFRRHVASEHVDRQVLKWLQNLISANQDMVTQGAMSLLGQDDLFTKAAIDSSIKNIEDLIEEGIPDDARNWLGMFGFRITVDVHGDVVDINAPTQSSDE